MRIRTAIATPELTKTIVDGYTKRSEIVNPPTYKVSSNSHSIFCLAGSSRDVFSHLDTGSGQSVIHKFRQKLPIPVGTKHCGD
jgi:hypothetical protein